MSVNRHPLDSIPELAGIATWESAAQVGLSVAENGRRLLRFHWVERRLMSVMVTRITATPVWEVKCALALHQWQCAEHADALRTRITEMRSPAPSLDTPPDNDPTSAALERFLAALDFAADAAELVAGFYGVALPALLSAYREHLDATNPLVDHPTIRVLRMARLETEDAIAWGVSAQDVLCAEPAVAARADAFRIQLESLLAEAGGVTGDRPMRRDSWATPPSAMAAPPADRFHPRRDDRFRGQYNFVFPPHVVYNRPGVPPQERNLALLCKRALEMDVPEMMASFMTERTDQPWEFYRDYSRQLWDEARHAMMGTVALQARGIDWKGDVPLNVSFALRLNQHATPIERQVMLFAIEQSLMPADTGKRFEYETAKAAGDELSAHFHDYDWADEVLHAQIGRRLLKREGISSQDAADRAHAIHDKTWAALERYRDREPQRNWWPAFVERTLGVPSAVAGAEDLGPINVFSE
jgi:hypothetical protein